VQRFTFIVRHHKTGSAEFRVWCTEFTDSLPLVTVNRIGTQSIGLPVSERIEMVEFKSGEFFEELNGTAALRLNKEDKYRY
jgi:hypothetical protein